MSAACARRDFLGLNASQWLFLCCWEGSGLKLPMDSPFDPTDSSSLRTCCWGQRSAASGTAACPPCLKLVDVDVWGEDDGKPRGVLSRTFKVVWKSLRTVTAAGYPKREPVGFVRETWRSLQSVIGCAACGALVILKHVCEFTTCV